MGGIVIVDSVSGGTTDGANKDLSNLTVTGEARFTAKAGVDLDNISSAGVSVITSYATGGGANTDLSNLSATGQAVIDGKANTDLDNLSVTGQAVIDGKANTNLMNTNFVTNGILSAPNGVATYSGLELRLPAGTVLACPNGINADGTRKSIVVTTASLLTVTTTAINGVPFKLVYQTTNYIDFRRTDTTYYYEQPTTPTGMSNGALWYNNSPSVNKCYYYDGSTWIENPFVVIADFSYTGGAISGFSPRYPVELLKSSDSEFIFNLTPLDFSNMETGIFNNTVTTTAQSYTLTKNGIVVLQASSGSGVFVTCGNGSVVSIGVCGINTAGEQSRLFTPYLKAGNIVSIQTGTGTATLGKSRFIPILGG